MARPSGAKCPICGEATQTLHRPFCSKRCADRDLAHWLNGNYAVPVVELDENDLDELERFVEGGVPEDDDSDGSSGDRD